MARIDGGRNDQPPPRLRDAAIRLSIQRGGQHSPLVSFTFQYASESDPGPYPVGADTSIESGSDRHALIINRDSCTLYELFDLAGSGSSWTAGSGAIFPLGSNALRPLGWTSADAAGLPIVPGLVRLDEVLAGAINHAIPSRQSGRTGASSGRPGIRPAQPPTRRCRPWVPASG